MMNTEVNKLLEQKCQEILDILRDHKLEKLVSMTLQACDEVDYYSFFAFEDNGEDYIIHGAGFVPRNNEEVTENGTELGD